MDSNGGLGSKDQAAEEKTVVAAAGVGQEREEVESNLERLRREVDEKFRSVRQEMADQAAQLRSLREDLDRRGTAASLAREPPEPRARTEKVESDSRRGRDGADEDNGPPAPQHDGPRGAGSDHQPHGASTGRGIIRTASTSTGAVTVALTPTILDSGDVYTINESVWDIMIFWGHDTLGPMSSAMIGMTYLSNIALQALFIYMIHVLLMEPTISPEILDGLLKFRLSLAHSVDYADKVTQRSMATQICNRERKLHLAGEQFNLFGYLNDYAEGGSLSGFLIWFIQLLWLLTILKDIENTYHISVAAMKIKKGRRTKMVLADLREEGVKAEALKSNPALRERAKAALADLRESAKRRRTPQNSGGDDVDFLDPRGELGGFMQVVRIISMCQSRRVLVQVCVCLPKIALAVALYIIGAAWLANTIDFTELILNGVALAFVLEFDEVLYSVLLPRRAKTLISNLEPLPLRPRSPGSRWSGVTAIGLAALVVPVLFCVYYAFLERIFWQLDQGHRILCSGNRDFIYAVNPATGMVHVTTTTGEDRYTDTEEVVAQVAKPDLDDHEWWDDLVASDIFDASVSDFARAVAENATDSFDLIVQMSVWSIAEAAMTLPCEDLASGQSANASVKALQELTQDPTITNCSDIPRDQCALLASTALRAICPRHCRCEETLLSNVGFFQRPEFGCPSQCETFKAARNEIEFRFELTKVDTGSSRRLQSNETVLFSSASSQGCSDLASTSFGFAGGCADSSGESRLDRNGDDCSIYEADPWKCGHADDDDFLAAELCCSCGGGYANVASSIDCYDDFGEQCWLMPEKAVRWLLYVRGLFEYLLSNPGFRDSVTSVVETDYAGIAPDSQTKEDLIEYIASGEMGRALASGSWDLMPGLAHPRGLSGCDYLSSYEITALLNIDLCAEGLHTPIRFFCPSACGCGASNGLEECPAACIFTDCLDGSLNESCGHVHPWYSEECIAGFHNDGGSATCYRCTGGETSRRRSETCTECTDGFYDMGNFDDCARCLGGATRRRRSTGCTGCEPGTYDASDSDDCTECVGGATTRRRATACAECAEGFWDNGAADDCVLARGCSTTRRRSSTCAPCAPGEYNNGTADECAPCEGGETRRRRDASACTPCPPGTRDVGAYDDCEPVPCPAHSVGQGENGVVDGCTCDVGYVGTILPSSKEPYYTGECKNLSFHYVTSGWCLNPILDPQLCLFGAQALGLTTKTEVVEVLEVFEQYACHVNMWTGIVANVNPIGTQECINHPCVCLGSQSDIICSDFPDAVDECPPTQYEDWWPWYQYCEEGDDDYKCCNCFEGGVHTKQFDSTCQDSSGGAVSDLLAYSFFDGCIKWDWFPDTCQWSSYYDDDDFTAATMCCACGGGIFTTTATTSSSPTLHTTTGSSITESSTTASR